MADAEPTGKQKMEFFIRHAITQAGSMHMGEVRRAVQRAGLAIKHTSLPSLVQERKLLLVQARFILGPVWLKELNEPEALHYDQFHLQHRRWSELQTSIDRLPAPDTSLQQIMKNEHVLQTDLLSKGIISHSEIVFILQASGSIQGKDFVRTLVDEQKLVMVSTGYAIGPTWLNEQSAQVIASYEQTRRQKELRPPVPCISCLRPIPDIPRQQQVQNMIKSSVQHAGILSHSAIRNIVFYSGAGLALKKNLLSTLVAEHKLSQGIDGYTLGPLWKQDLDE
jgi:hypothetical protein